MKYPLCYENISKSTQYHLGRKVIMSAASKKQLRSRTTADQDASHGYRGQGGHMGYHNTSELADEGTSQRRGSSSSKKQSSSAISGTQSRYSSADSYNGRDNNLTNGDVRGYNGLGGNNQGNDDEEEEEEDYSYDYDEDFEDDFESETEEGSYNDDTYNDDTQKDESRYDDNAISYNNSTSSYAANRLNQEMRQVKQSIMEENKYKGSTTKPNHGSRDNEGDTKSKSNALNRSFINFSSAKQRQSSKLLAGKTRQRGDELLTMIRLGM